MKFNAVSTVVKRVIENSPDRVIASDAVVAALLNRGIEVNIIVGS